MWMKSSKKPQIKKFNKTEPPKSGKFDSKSNFEISKEPKFMLKIIKPIRRLQINRFYENNPLKGEF